ncbi:hypothetical protein ACTNEN_09705 [Oribacterium sp. HCP28S3_H8]|uniref:hypothetical protein n=1 Tax=Oribacterium sp. HCP28S3_H8 TaxID=3438945 RepID=UPI003F8A0759
MAIKQTDPHKRGKSSRDKGKRGELELVNLIRDTWGYDVRRGKVFYHESDMVGLDGIHPEIKRKERLNVDDAMQQAVEEAAKRKDGLPTVFHRKDRGEWLVTMKLSDWIDLYGAWNEKE